MRAPTRSLLTQCTDTEPHFYCISSQLDTQGTQHHQHPVYCAVSKPSIQLAAYSVMWNGGGFCVGYLCTAKPSSISLLLMPPSIITTLKLTESNRSQWGHDPANITLVGYIDTLLLISLIFVCDTTDFHPTLVSIRLDSLHVGTFLCCM